MTQLKLALLLCCMLPLSSAAAQTDYQSESGFYSASLPDGWERARSDVALHLVRGDLSMHLFELPPDEPEALIQRAFEMMSVEPAGPLINSVDAPLPNGVWKQEIYGEGAWLHVGLAQAREDGALVLLVFGEQTDLQAANPTILNLLSSIQFGEVERPAYAHLSEYEETDVSFGAEPYVLHGALSMPVGEGPFPAAVIAHGSGPQNRDGIVGPLLPYRDIALGMASHGIAVLRFDKRTFTYGTEITIDDQFTIDSESTDDALHAIDFLRGQERINPERLFVIGHSQGGSVTLRILARDADIAGGILLAAPARPFSVLLDEQLAYIAEVNPDAEGSPQMSYLQGLLDQFAQVEAGETFEETFGDAAVYMRSLETLDPIAEAREIAAPLLILQGERDYQVTMDDFAGWQAAYGEDERVTLISFPKLNHFFMASGDQARLSVPQDYEIPAFVDWVVIETMVEWIG